MKARWRKGGRERHDYTKRRAREREAWRKRRDGGLGVHCAWERGESVLARQGES